MKGQTDTWAGFLSLSVFVLAYGFVILLTMPIPLTSALGKHGLNAGVE